MTKYVEYRTTAERTRYSGEILATKKNLSGWRADCYIDRAAQRQVRCESHIPWRSTRGSPLPISLHAMDVPSTVVSCARSIICVLCIVS